MSDEVDHQLQLETPERKTGQILVLIRFLKDRYDAFRNSVVKSKPIIRNYGGEFVGLAQELDTVTSGSCHNSTLTMGVLLFNNEAQCRLWAVSDTNLKQQDWLDGTDQIAIPLIEPLKRGCVFQVCNLLVYNPNDLYGRYLPALETAIAKHGGHIIAKSTQTIKFKGVWEPYFIVVSQWPCTGAIDAFHHSEDNPPTNLDQGSISQFHVSYDL